MEASTHFNDVTNLTASPRSNVANNHAAIIASQSAHPDAAQQAHTGISSDTGHDASSQHMLMKQNPSGPVFGSSHLAGSSGPGDSVSGAPSSMQDVDGSCQIQQLDASAPLSSAEVQVQGSESEPASLAQRYGEALHAHLGNVPMPTVTHDYFFSPADSSDHQAMVQGHSGSNKDQCDAQVLHDPSHGNPIQPKTELPTVFEHQHQVKSYLPSPPMRSHMTPQPDSRSFDASTRSTEGRHVFSHRPSHSLGQAGAFMTGLPDRDMFAHSHVSAPVSPSDGISSGAFAALFQYPGARHEIGLGMTEHGHPFDQSAAQGLSRSTGHLPKSCAPSVRSASPSTSMASTSMTSISPLGSARINPDGSFTSQETSFDSISNAASGSFSRASSTSEENFYQELGSLGLASSLRMTKQKKKLRNIDRKMICDYSVANPMVKQDAIANVFGIERSTVSKILKQKEKWLAIDPQSDAARIAKHRAVKFPAVEDRLTSWVAALKTRGEPVRDSTIRQEALRIARELGLGEDKFKASGGWIEKFRERNQIPKPQPGDAASAASSADQDGTTASACARTSADPAAGSGTPTEASVMAFNGAMNDDSTSEAQSRTTRRQPTRNSKVKGTPQKRSRDDEEKTRAILSMSPLNHDLSRMHFNNGAPVSSMPDPAFFRPNLYSPCPAAPQFMANNNLAYGGHCVPSSMPLAEDADESERKRRRSGQHLDADQNTMGLGPAIDFQFPPPGAPGCSSEGITPGSPSHGQGQADPGAPTASPRGRRSVGKSSTETSGRGRARRGKGRLSGVNHAPQTPSPLSMSPADARGVAMLQGLNAADAEQITAATLERIRALQNSGDKSSIVTAEQARQSLELVLRFLSEQPSDFLPANHFVVFGHLQANIEQKIRDQAKESPSAAEGSGPLHAGNGASPHGPAGPATPSDAVGSASDTTCNLP